MRLSTWVLLGVGLSGCFHEVRPEPKVTAFADTRLPLRVKYYLPRGERARVDNHRYFNLGIIHVWNIEIGEALADSVPQMLDTVFASVTPASGPTDVDDADVFVSPVITSFDVDGGNLVSTLKIRFLVLGADREAILEEEVTASSLEDSAWMWGGAFTGVATLRTSTEQAFELLMRKTAARLFEALRTARSRRELGV